MTEMYRIAMYAAGQWIILPHDGFFGYNETLKRAKMYKEKNPERRYSILKPDWSGRTDYVVMSEV